MSASAPVFSGGRWSRTRVGEGHSELDVAGMNYAEYSLNGVDWIISLSWRTTRLPEDEPPPA
jgi:hypothetical protein